MADGQSAGGDLVDAVLSARGNDRFLEALSRLLEQADAKAREISARCWGGGACCRFDLMDHRLYLSSGELALLLCQPPLSIEQARAGRCPYQQGPRCMARDRRPLGCRTYFCDRRTTEVMRQLHERLHGGIRRLHESCLRAYAYAELTESVMQLVANPRVKSYFS